MASDAAGRRLENLRSPTPLGRREVEAPPAAGLSAPLLDSTTQSREGVAPSDSPGDPAPAARVRSVFSWRRWARWLANQQVAAGQVAGQCACSFLLMLSCVAAMVLVLCEVVQGTTRSVYCSLDKNETLLAPPVCVVPLTTAAAVCHFDVVAGMLCIARFAWSTRGSSFLGGSAIVEQQRTVLRSDLKRWRGISARVLLAAALVFVLVGTPCAGQARMAFIFLATGFLSLYATTLFFDDDFEHVHVRLSPRLFRFLGVYTLVGITFTALTTSVSDWFDGRAPGSKPGVAGRIPPPDTACTAAGRSHLAPPWCTVPLDLVSGLSTWWAASPLFSTLLTEPRTSADRLGGSSGGRWSLRRVLQRYRSDLDGVVLLVTCLVILLVYNPCQHEAPVAFTMARFGLYAVGAVVCLRRITPDCDGWRGPLEHLAAPPPRPSLAADAAPAQCSVCLNDLRPGEDLCRTPCGHDFHRECLEDWALSRRSRSGNCPLCREPFDVGIASSVIFGAGDRSEDLMRRALA